MDRQHRHDLKHDRFVDQVGHLSSRAHANQRVLYTIGGAALLLALLIYGFFFYRSNREENAQQALAVAIETFEAPVGDQPQQQASTAGPKFKTEQERTAASGKLFKEVQDEYSGTDAADVAGLYLARIAVTNGDVKTARTHLEKFVDAQKDHVLAEAARFSLYQLRIGNGEAAQVAVEITAELAKTEPVLPGDSLLMLLSQAYEVQGDSAKSVETLRRLTTEYPESPYTIDAQRRVGA